METATVIHEGECQTVCLPKGFHISTPTVGVRHEGEAIVLEPLHPKTWPSGFFDSIHITDLAFLRLGQGPLPQAQTGTVEQGIAEKEVLKNCVETKAKEFVEKGVEIYAKT